MSQPTETTLNLERSRMSRAFPHGESLWESELKRLCRLLGLHLEALELAPGTKKNSELPTLSISIFGTYGSGKSSLLKTLCSYINDGSGGNTGKYSAAEFRNRVRALPVIDQGLFNDNGHFLYAFLATALEEVRTKEEEEGIKQEKALSRLERGFHRFSEYLQVVDQGEGGLERDPLGYSLERLERHASGVLLRDRLDKWLDLLAEELTGIASNSVILMPVDDADMSLRNLITTLGTFRRYLTHPRLVPVFTFTDRLAEELLQNYFADSLSSNGDRGGGALPNQDASPYSLDMTERLAYQYLVKLFPIRNRIRLGPAPARAQAAKYSIVSNRKGDAEAVHHLLWTASELLFGRAEWPTAPGSRLSLRPTTLRRQIQVIDAMVDSHVLEVHDKDKMARSWAAIFDRAAWSLLNVHRDVLTELRIYIEDLYSWTPETLRRALLDYILSLELETRRRLIKQWRYSIDDRRSQMLSLLAANTFRPSMQGEELSGDDPDKIVQLGSTIMERDQGSPHSFSLLKGVLWFLNLWIGFYLPQILARNRQDDIANRDPHKGRVRGFGWDLHSGPTHSIREALANGEVASTGMMLLEPHEFSQQIPPGLRDEKPGQMDSVSLLLHTWCLYGQERKPWAAVSFWRGLALLGQLLILREREIFRRSCLKEGNDKKKDDDRKSDDNCKKQKSLEDEVKAAKEAIASLIHSHCDLVRVPGLLGEDQVEYVPFRPGSNSQLRIEKLSEEVDRWLFRFDEIRISPFWAAKKKSMTQWDRERLWRNCFIRRMHGEHILGDFWRMLEGTYLEKPDADENSTTSSWTAWTALTKWVETLLVYTEKGRNLQGAANHFGDASWVTLFFAECPFIHPFLTPKRRKQCKKGMGKIYKHQLEKHKGRLNLLDKEEKKKEEKRFNSAWSESLHQTTMSTKRKNDKADCREDGDMLDSVFELDKIRSVFDFLKRLESFEGGPRTV